MMYKSLADKDKVKMTGINSAVREIIETTGFSQFFLSWETQHPLISFRFSAFLVLVHPVICTGDTLRQRQMIRSRYRNFSNT